MHALHRNWGWLLALGILLIIMGVFLVLAPAAGTLAVEIFIGWLLIIGGVAQIVHAFSVRGWDGFLLHLLGASSIWWSAGSWYSTRSKASSR